MPLPTRVTLAPARLAELVERYPSRRIAVLGDFFLDKYLEVDPALEELSLETGRPAHQVVGVRASPGAAGTIVSNLASLGAGEKYAIGSIGDDGEGYELRKALELLGCSTEHLQVLAGRHTPTYLKPRDATRPGLAGEHCRYDTKNRSEVPHSAGQEAIRALDRLLPSLHAVIVLDQVDAPGTGVVTRPVREELAARAERFPRVVFWADSRRRIHEFRRVIIKPNQFEAVGRNAPSPGEEIGLAELESVVRQLRSRNGAPVAVTLGARGMAVSDPEWTLVPGVAVRGEVDPTGAGDSATAAAVLALASGATLPEAALAGNLAASITVEQLGTTGTARPAGLLERLEVWRAQQAELAG